MRHGIFGTTDTKLCLLLCFDTTINVRRNQRYCLGHSFCHYGETNNAFLVGGLVHLSETLMASAIHYCRHLVNFGLEHNDRLYLVKTTDGFMDHEHAIIIKLF